jgi:hypothetical protein
MPIRTARLVLVIALGFAAFALAPAARAGTITIVITQRAELADGKLTVHVEVKNTGDEAAYSVTPKVVFGDKEVRGKSSATLDPNGSMTENLVVEVGELKPGRWPYRVAVDYADANQYPFQALHATSYLVGTPPPAKIAVPKIASEGIAGTGNVQVTVKNLGEEARQVQVKLMTPEGLEANQTDDTLELAAWEETTVTIPVTNRTALAGSTYPLFLSVEYDDGDAHQSIIAPSTVKILASDTVLDQRSQYLWWGAAILGLIFVVLAGVRMMRGGEARA